LPGGWPTSGERKRSRKKKRGLGKKGGALNSGAKEKKEILARYKGWSQMNVRKRTEKTNVPR